MKAKPEKTCRYCGHTFKADPKNFDLDQWFTAFDHVANQLAEHLAECEARKKHWETEYFSTILPKETP